MISETFFSPTLKEKKSIIICNIFSFIKNHNALSNIKFMSYEGKIEEILFSNVMVIFFLSLFFLNKYSIFSRLLLIARNFCTSESIQFFQNVHA